MKRTLALLLFASSVSLLARAEETRADRWGAPLPGGATERLGTLRLRHAGTTTTVAFSPDGKEVASAGEDKTVRLWELATGKELEKIDLGSAARALRFGPKGTLLSYSDGLVRITDLATRKETRRFGTAGARGVFSAKGDMIAAADANGTVTVNEVPSGKILLEVHGDAAVDALAFSPDGKRLALGSRDNAIRVWEIEPKTETRLLGHEGWVTALAFSPDGKTLWSGSADRTIRIWQGGHVVKRLDGQKGFVQMIEVSADGKLFAAWSTDGSLVVRDVPAFKERSERRAVASAIAFSPDGKLLAYATRNAVAFSEAETGKEHAVVSGHEGVVTCVAFSPDGRTIASGSEDETIRLWETGGGRELRRIQAHEGGVLSLAWAPGGRLLASGGQDNCVRLWDAATGNQVTCFMGHTDVVVSVAFSPDGKLLGSCGDGTIRLWDLATGKMTRAIGVGGDPGPLSWSSDGKTLAIGSGDHLIRTFDCMTGKEGKRLDQMKKLLALTFSPDGRTIAAVGEEPSLLLWDVPEEVLGRTIELEDTTLGAVAFFRDGKRLVVGRADGPVRVVEAASGKVLKTLDAGTSGPFSIATSPDGRMIAWGAVDGTVLVGDAR